MPIGLCRGRHAQAPVPIPPLAIVWVCFATAASAPKPPVERAWIVFFFFPLMNGSAVRQFLSGYSFPFSSRLAE